MIISIPIEFSKNTYRVVNSNSRDTRRIILKHREKSKISPSIFYIWLNSIELRCEYTIKKMASKRTRENLSFESKKILKEWLFDHRYNPYPTEIEKTKLASETNLTVVQINNWFINERRRSLPKIMVQEGSDLKVIKRKKENITMINVNERKPKILQPIKTLQPMLPVEIIPQEIEYDTSHLDVAHNNSIIVQYYCQVCGNIFNEKENLDIHINENHSSYEVFLNEHESILS